MTATSFNDFKKMYFKIPKEILSYVQIIPIRLGGKEPEVRGSWKPYNLTYWEIKDRLKMGKNIAVVAKHSGLMFLDLDKEDGKFKCSSEILEICEKIDTLKIRTRSGGLHLYFLNDGKYDTQNFLENGEHIGELRANESYVIGAGSWVHEDGVSGTYRIEQDSKIASFEGDICKYFKTNENEKINHINNNKEDIYEGVKGEDIEYENELRRFFAKEKTKGDTDRLIQVLEAL